MIEVSAFMTSMQERCKGDVLDAMERNPQQVTAVLSALEKGRVEGRLYFGECSCLLGTINSAKPVPVAPVMGWVTEFETVLGRKPCGCTPAEEWFSYIRKGDTPEDSRYSTLAYQWIEEWAEGKGLLK